jgi:hypothetical protein
MRYLLLLSFLLTCRLATAQAVSTNAHQTNLFAGYLEGDIQIRHASDRPAARAYFLLYAAALDRYATENKEVLASHPPLALLLRDAQGRALLTFDRYNVVISGGFAPIADRKRELADLERFIASGYCGELKPKLLAYIEELKK